MYRINFLLVLRLGELSGSGFDARLLIYKVQRRTVPVFVFGDVKNARDLHLQLRQAAHFVVNEVPGW